MSVNVEREAPAKMAAVPNQTVGFNPNEKISDFMKKITPYPNKPPYAALISTNPVFQLHTQRHMSDNANQPISSVNVHNGDKVIALLNEPTDVNKLRVLFVDLQNSVIWIPNIPTFVTMDMLLSNVKKQFPSVVGFSFMSGPILDSKVTISDAKLSGGDTLTAVYTRSDG